MYRNKSDQKFSQGQAPWVSPFTGVPNDPRTFGLRHEVVGRILPLPRSPAPAVSIDNLCLSFGVPCFVLYFLLGGALRQKSARTDCWGENPAPLCVKTISGKSETEGVSAIFTARRRRLRSQPNEVRLLGGVLDTFQSIEKYLARKRNSLTAAQKTYSISSVMPSPSRSCSHPSSMISMERILRLSLHSSILLESSSLTSRGFLMFFSSRLGWVLSEEWT